MRILDMALASDSDVCGYAETTSGEPCQNPAVENGRCWIPSHNPGPDNENPGRPTKLTRERQERVAAAIESGHSFRSACEQGGHLDGNRPSLDACRG